MLCPTYVRLVVVLAIFSWARIAIAQQPADLPPEVVAYADTVFYNGKVYTADEQSTVAEAVAVRDGKFLAIGTSERILRMAGPRTRKVDLQNTRSIVPAFWDTHYHMDDHAIRMKMLEEKNIQWEGKNLWNTLHWENVVMGLRDLEKAVRAAKPGELVWVPVTIPTAEDVVSQMTLDQLDMVAPANPLIISSAVRLQPEAVNRLVYQKLVPMSPDTEGYPKGISAVVTGEAKALLHDFVRWVIPIEEQIPWHKEAMRRANSWGVVGVDTRVEPSHLTAIREIWAAGEMTVRLRAAIQVLDAGDPEKIIRAMGNFSDVGDDLLKITGISAGGSLGGGGLGFGVAWTFDPQRNPPNPDTPYGRGSTAWAAGPGKELMTAIRYGWNFNNTHVVGDRAVAEFLKVLEEGYKTRLVRSKTQRLTIDHTPMARPEEIRKMKELGVMPSIAPWHFFVYGGGPEQVANVYGREEAHRMLPVKSYLDMGIRASLEADVIQAPDGLPLWKIEKVVARKDDQGQVWGPQEKVTRQQALRMSTLFPAEANGDGKKMGSIEVGKLADLVVLGQDYMGVPEDAISKIPILMTFLGGKAVYESSR